MSGIEGLLSRNNKLEFASTCTALKIKPSIKDFLNKCDQIRRKLTEEILNGKLHFLCSVEENTRRTPSKIIKVIQLPFLHTNSDNLHCKRLFHKLNPNSDKRLSYLSVRKVMNSALENLKLCSNYIGKDNSRADTVKLVQTTTSIRRPLV